MFEIIGLFFIFFIVFIDSANAIEMTPMVITFDPSDTSRMPFTLIYNELSRDIAFDIQVYDIVFNGTDIKLMPLSDPPLWVFPPSLFLKSGQSQRVQFRWLEKELPPIDKSYQVSFMEYPVNNDVLDNRSKLNVLLDVNLIVHVDQPDLTPIFLISNYRVKDGSLFAEVKNIGKGSSRLSDYDIRVMHDNDLVSHVFKSQLKAQGYDVFFAPDSKQTIKIPLPESIYDVDLATLKIEMAD
jgi:hypothetical protein|tara:strand:- start:4539 stop:5258 length:720 start_codon:yes stop_codon:yes gene_type:complete